MTKTEIKKFNYKNLQGIVTINYFNENNQTFKLYNGYLIIPAKLVSKKLNRITQDVTKYFKTNIVSADFTDYIWIQQLFHNETETDYLAFADNHKDVVVGFSTGHFNDFYNNQYNDMTKYRWTFDMAKQNVKTMIDDYLKTV